MEANMPTFWIKSASLSGIEGIVQLTVNQKEFGQETMEVLKPKH